MFRKKTRKTDSIKTQAVSKQNNAETPKMNLLYRFFCWCSGARIYILRQCPTDYNVFFGIGIVILLTGTLASLSGGYAFYTVFNDVRFAAIFGVFWGTLIFFLDWYLVSSLKKQNHFRKELFMSIPRFVFAFFLAVVIAKPIEMKLFESEINAEIADYRIKRGFSQQKKLDESFAELDKLANDNENMALQIKLKEIQRNELFDLVINEAEGRSVTGQSGKGPVYREKKQALQQIEEELGQLKEQLLPLIKLNTERIVALRQKRDASLAQNQEVLDEANGFLARIEAMNRLSRKSAQTNMVSWFVMLLFLCIESAPIFVKLISQRGAYDRLLDALTEKQRLEMDHFIEKLQTEHLRNTSTNRNRAQQENEMAEEQYGKYLEQLRIAKTECDDKIVEHWKKQEFDKIDKRFDAYIPAIESIFKTKHID